MWILIQRVDQLKAWAVSVIGTIIGFVSETAETAFYSVCQVAAQPDIVLKYFQYCSFGVAIISGLLAAVVSVQKIIKNKKLKK